MMNKSEIDWCDFTWNPVTGCPRGCKYCYARKQARRFCGDIRLNMSSSQIAHAGNGTYILEKPFRNNKGTVIPFPAGFEPTFHRYRLPMPAQKKKPANIFVVSMGDLFAPAISTRWIVDVFDACAAAPWHNYLFLTKFPERYEALEHLALLPHSPNFWYGTTVTKAEELPRIEHIPLTVHRFVSIEPILEPVDIKLGPVHNPAGPAFVVPPVEWVIVGAETGNQREKTAPAYGWLTYIAGEAKRNGVPVLLKDSDEMREALTGGELIQEFPPELWREDIPVPHCDGCEHHTAELRHHNRARGDVYNHTCDAGAQPRKVPGRYARTSPLWCPKRKESTK